MINIQNNLETKIIEIIKMLNGLINSLKLTT